MGLEFAAQAAEAGVTEADVLVCCGGGGLISGIALALERDGPGLRPRPVEPVGFDDVTRSLISGKIESNAAVSGSLCDAITTPSPGESDFPDHVTALRPWRSSCLMTIASGPWCRRTSD